MNKEHLSFLLNSKISETFSKEILHPYIESLDSKISLLKNNEEDNFELIIFKKIKRKKRYL